MLLKNIDAETWMERLIRPSISVSGSATEVRWLVRSVFQRERRVPKNEKKSQESAAIRQFQCRNCVYATFEGVAESQLLATLLETPYLEGPERVPIIDI